METISFLLNQALDKIADLNPELNCEAEALRQTLSSPPRIVITGRLKAGKSTLANALIGAPVSETAALEATNVVTIFTYGAPDRAIIKFRDGTEQPIEIRRGKEVELPAPADKISYIKRWMPVNAIAEFSLIDTPGLATLTGSNEDATRRALIDGYEQTREASLGADAAIFLFDSVPRSDELDFISQLGFTPLNTLGVLSRADSFAEGALGEVDPLEMAAQHAHKLADKLRSSLLTVLPIAGLLAETSNSGALTETITRQIAELNSVSDTRLICQLAESDPDQESAESLHKIVNLIGEYGLFHGRAFARKGATEMNEWLFTHSGLPSLNQTISELLGPHARLHRATRALEQIEHLAYKYHDCEQEILSILSQLKNSPQSVYALLLNDLKALLASDPSSPLVDVVKEVITGKSLGQKVGIDEYANGFSITDAIQKKRSWMQSYSFNMISPAEEATILNLHKAYNIIEQGVQAYL